VAFANFGAVARQATIVSWLMAGCGWRGITELGAWRLRVASISFSIAAFSSSLKRMVRRFVRWRFLLPLRFCLPSWLMPLLLYNLGQKFGWYAQRRRTVKAVHPACES
jgi:hypothetical protein